jgi:hypothetical protein
MREAADARDQQDAVSSATGSFYADGAMGQ